jgi:hypothetical protein
MTGFLLERIAWPLLDYLERNSAKCSKARSAALDRFRKKHWEVSLGGFFVGLYYVQYVREKAPICIMWESRRDAVNHYKKFLERSDISEVYCRRLSNIVGSCDFEYLYKQRLSEEDYKLLNRDVTNVLLSLAWYRENYGTEHSLRSPTAELDRRVFSELLGRGVFTANREPHKPQDLLYDGVDYMWEGWELSQVLLHLGIETPLRDWAIKPGDINPFANSKIVDGDSARDTHYKMIKNFLNNTYNLRIPSPIGNFDIWRIGQTSGELEKTFGKGYVEQVKADRKDRYVKWYLDEGKK